MIHKSARVAVPCLVLAAVLVAGIFGRTVRAQENTKTVADGVYSEEQATRGAAAYDTACSGCHRPDLGGGNGPALRGERFARIFAGKDLKTFYTKIATTMPRGAPASMGDDVYLDIVAHVLRENGFPAGTQELATDALSGINVLPGRPKPPPPVGDFSYVEVVGCLVPGPDNTWLLSRASEPVGLAMPDRPNEKAAVRATSPLARRCSGCWMRWRTTRSRTRAKKCTSGVC